VSLRRQEFGLLNRYTGFTGDYRFWRRPFNSFPLWVQFGHEIGRRSDESRLDSQIKEFSQFRDRKIMPSLGPLTLLHDNCKQMSATPC
jgi:hypothetical protein